ncbi:glycosyl transferase family 90-domain-containing protein, partial [Chytriomyces sp. MP71]
MADEDVKHAWTRDQSTLLRVSKPALAVAVLFLILQTIGITVYVASRKGDGNVLNTHTLSDAASAPMSPPALQTKNVSEDIHRLLSDAEAIAVYKKTHGMDPPPGFDMWLNFTTQANCSMDITFYAQIYRDLAPWWKDGINPASLEHIDLSRGLTHTISFDTTTRKFMGYQDAFWILQLPKIFEPIEPIFQLHKEFKFVMNGFDEPRHLFNPNKTSADWQSPADLFAHSQCFRDHYEKVQPYHAYLQTPATFVTKNVHAPIFSQCKPQCYEDIVMPMHYHQKIALGGRVVDPVRWEDKLPVLFFRGANTGGWSHVEFDWQMYHRIRLVEWGVQYAKQHPGLSFDAGKDKPPAIDEGQVAVDIGFYAYSNECTDELTKKYLMQRFGVKGTVEFTDTLKFKYLIVVDGHAWPSRLQQYLQTNSVILYNGIFTDFFNWRLLPWVHYVPIAKDFSDLEDTLVWLQKNDDKARQIMENAHTLMNVVGSLSHMQCYTSLLLLEYSRLYNA